MSASDRYTQDLSADTRPVSGDEPRDAALESGAEPTFMAHIIVVEDERELATITSNALREEGHMVEVFTDGRGALDRLTGPGQQEPDLIVLDLMLPGVDGLEITRRVRQTKITPILMLTAKSTELDRVLGLELGAVTTTLPSPSRSASYRRGLVRSCVGSR